MSIRTLLPGFAIAALVLAGGCGRSDQTAHKDGGEGPGAAQPAPAPADAGAGRVAVGSEVQFAGTLGCGHCSFHVTNECAAVVKTASGEVYVLDGVDESSPLWEKRLETGHTITVAGKLAGVEPVKHVTMTSFELN
jgi:hypothetical protein